MTEKELIGKIRKLRQIKPNKDWVVLTKTQILGQESPQTGVLANFFGFLLKPAYASLVIIFVLFGLFGSAQNSLPGDTLYIVKEFAEKSQAMFLSASERPQFNLNLAQKRVEELAKVAEENRVKNLAPAIDEVKKSIANASKELSGDPVAIKKAVDEIEEKVEKINALGVVVETEELEQLKQNADKLFVEYLISDLKTRTLTEKQTAILNQMEELVKEEKYSEAIILYHSEFNKPAEENKELEETENEILEKEI